MYLYKQGNPRKKAQRGFTLVELLLVLVILALIAGLVLPGIIGKAESAKSKAAASAISRISMSVESFSSLDELVNEPSGVTGWNGPYIKASLLKDPWGRPYQYRSPGEHGDFDIQSFGADGQQGGEKNNADITSWE